MEGKRYLLYILVWLVLTIIITIILKYNQGNNILIFSYFFASAMCLQIGYFHITIKGDKYIKKAYPGIYYYYKNNQCIDLGYPVCIALRLVISNKHINDVIVVKLKHEILIHIIATIIIIIATILFCLIMLGK